MARPPHLPSFEAIAAWPEFTAERPLALLVSGCVAALPCGFDGTSYGEHTLARKLLGLPNVRAISFCPEDAAFGTPRAVCDIVGGNGFDVLDGRARVVIPSGDDWTDRLIASANRMLELARREWADLALLMDISAACGSQVIYDGARSDGRYQKGPGVAAALLIRNGVKIVSQRDDRTIHHILRKLDPAHLPDPAAEDHHERPWYRSYFPQP